MRSWQVVHRSRIAFAAAVCLTASCGRVAGPRPPVDPAMAACIPAGATLLAGIDLVRLRASPLYSSLPQSAAALVAPLGEARSLLVASDGKNLLVIARGPFRQAPAGAMLLGDGLAIAGTPNWTNAAAVQHRTGKPGAPDLVADAAEAAANPIWIAALGGRPLPLSGNAANLNRLLRAADHAVIGVQLDDPVRVQATVVGRTADAARQVEETLRASITMTAAAESRHGDVVAMLRAIQLSRDDRTVRATLSASPEQARRMLGALGP